MEFGSKVLLNVVAAMAAFPVFSTEGKPTTCDRMGSQYYTPTMFSPYVYADWLYWQPVTEDPMNWEERYGSHSETGFDSNRYITESIHYDYSPGFRIGAGYRIGQNAFDNSTRPWQIEAIYTRLATSASSSNTNQGLTINSGPLEIYDVLDQLLPNLNNDYLEGHSKSNLQYNKIDVEFAWPMWLGSNVIFRLMTGATFSWVDNSWRSRWMHQLDDSGSTFQTMKTDLNWDWWGGGLSAGGDICLPIGYGLGFFGDAGFALLFGRITKFEQYQLQNSSGDSFNRQNNSYRFHSFQPEVHFSAGIDYKRWFNQTVLLHLSAGWEFTWWFNLNQFGQINSNQYSGSSVINVPTLFYNEPSGLGFNGLTTRIGLDF